MGREVQNWITEVCPTYGNQPNKSSVSHNNIYIFIDNKWAKLVVQCGITMGNKTP